MTLSVGNRRGGEANPCFLFPPKQKELQTQILPHDCLHSQTYIPNKYRLVFPPVKNQVRWIISVQLTWTIFPLLIKRTALFFNLCKWLKVSIFLKLSRKGFIIPCTYTSTFCCESQYLLHFFSAFLNGTCVWLLNKHECIQFCNTSTPVIC